MHSPTLRKTRRNAKPLESIRSQHGEHSRDAQTINTGSCQGNVQGIAARAYTYYCVSYFCTPPERSSKDPLATFWGKKMRFTLSSGAVFALAITIAFVPPAHAEPPSEKNPDALEQAFANPPQSARPRVWWHWVNANVTEEGIQKDLEWMKRIGVGGVQAFDVGLGGKKIVDRPLEYMTPEWKSAFRFAAKNTDALGLELTIPSSPGWSQTGAPWVTPQEAMKKVVWSDTEITGGIPFHGVLAAPPSVTGPYQNIASTGQTTTFYADAIVLAFPITARALLPTPRYERSDGTVVDVAQLVDGSSDTNASIPTLADTPPTLVIKYKSPQTIRSASFFIRSAKSTFSEAEIAPILQVRDGTAWRTISAIPITEVPTTVSFAPETASEFRVVVTPLPGAKPKRDARIAEFTLSGDMRVHAFQAKAGFAVVHDYYALTSGASKSEMGVSPGDVIDITNKMAADGTLSWTPPPGRWRVLRLGYSLRGTTNHPANPAATGLEVDKYDSGSVTRYFKTYLANYKAATGSDLFGARGLQAVLTDSIEVPPVNWTPAMITKFKNLRGYDPTPWLPTLSGVVIGAREESDAFLYDFRRTLADLIAQEHYGVIAKIAHESGLKVYGESLEGGRPVLGDDMTMRSYADIPMAALWTFDRDAGPNPQAFADMRGAASVANVYGRQFVAAESMTSASKPWAHAPSDLRRIVDLEFASGINRIIIHTSVHQPTEDAPGLSLAVFGQYFTRHETWAEMARPWIEYIARSSYMLQQGKHVADLAYFSGEEAPLTRLHGDEPVRYGYDYVNAGMLMNAFHIKNGVFISAGGAQYRALYLGGTSQKMTLPVLRKLAEFANAGSVIIGAAPDYSPSLRDDRAEFRSIVKSLWGTRKNKGNGRVIVSADAEAALRDLNISPDFETRAIASNSDIMFLHRAGSDGDIYFVRNGRDRREQFEAIFRVAGKQPEIWRADSGEIVPASYRIEDGRTVLPLDMAAEESFFVVFRKPGAPEGRTIALKKIEPVLEVQGPWRVDFQENRGAPKSIPLESLQSLSQQKHSGVKYFSGVASYTTNFTATNGSISGAPLWLDLGGVADLAEVFINGTNVGIAWKAPYRVDISRAVKSGRNRLEVRVANLWVNRLIGDAQPDATQVTSTIFPTYSANAPLRPAGLLGPVRIIRNDSSSGPEE